MFRWIPAALALTLVAAAAPATAEDWTKTYDVTRRPDLRIETDDGNVHVETWDRNAVEVRVTAPGWKIGPGGTGHLRIVADQQGNQIDVQVSEPHVQFRFSFKDLSHRSIRVDVRVPRTANLDLETGDGGVTVEPVAGQIRVTTGDGSIQVDGLHGDILLHSGDGTIDGKNLEGTLIARTGDGPIRVNGTFESLRLTTGDGAIVAEADEGSKIGDGWAVNTGDGSVLLRIPSDLNADLDAHSGDGDISFDFPVKLRGSFARNTIHGKINGGGPPLKLRTGDGTIRIENL